MLSINDNEFFELANYIKNNFGIDLKHKKILIEGRLSNMIQEKGFESFKEYINNVLADSTGEEIQTLLNKITTNHTFFMRESAHFDFFKNFVLPSVDEKSKEKDLRIWSAGCSSGEEPYTLAMLMSEYFGDKKAYWDTKILATDISAQALEKGRMAIYSKEAIECISPDLKYKYFLKKNNNEYEISPKIKNEVIFREFNLMEDLFPFKKKFHAIFCRNVMIYFDQKTKVELINKFYDITEQGGYLFIGHSEYIDKEETKYKHVIPAVYRKI